MDKKQNKKKIKDIRNKKPKTSLAKSKKRLFWIITLSIPLVFFFLLESGLRIFNYGGNLDLFIEGPPGYEEYLRPNLNVARRYFYLETGVPAPPLQLFHKEKPENGYRIFVLGGSSTAGFPYSSNASFPNILGRSLSNTFPEKNIEVINVAMAAVNSYALLDLFAEILEQSPDLILIYAGHNEYYGALGVGSVQSLGNWRWLIRTYLNLQSFKTFILIRDFIGWIRLKTGSLIEDVKETDPANTLMARIVAEQTIPYKSSLYEDGKNQFEENIESILQEASENKVPVILSELVSNMKDQEPFISVEGKNRPSAKKVYDQAKSLEKKGKYSAAKAKYTEAKDLDALRFRAPEEFNLILKELSKKYSVPLVPAVLYFEKESLNGLIGNNLILEHLHPNYKGYWLIAKAFYETVEKNNIINGNWQEDYIAKEYKNGVTDLDSVYAAMVIKHLKGGWPFKPKSARNLFLTNYIPENNLEEISLRVIKTKDYNLEYAHMELGKNYEKQGEFDKAYKEYQALITSIPHEVEFYERAATVLLKEKKYEEADSILKKSLQYKESYFANKWIGQIALINDKYGEAISFLQKADKTDDQVVFNLSRAFYLNNQWNKGDEYFQRLQDLAPESAYLSHLIKLRTMLKIKVGREKSKI